MVNEWSPTLSVIGKAGNLDKEGLLTVTGKLDFTADHFFPDKLHAKILHCPYAHAKVNSIDASKALALEGVAGVCTHADFVAPANIDGWAAEKYWWGAPVAIVAAVDELTADQALQLIKVDYTVLPFVINPDEAMKTGAPLMGVWPDTNVRQASSVTRGNIDAGFAQAEVTVEATTGWTSYYHLNYLETACALVWWNGDKINCWLATQNPTGDRTALAQAFGISENMVSVYSHGTGGGYGGKQESNPHIEAAVMSKKVGGRPVQIQRTRWNHYFNRRHQDAAKAYFKIGAKKDGTLTALQDNFWANVGANSGGSAGQNTPVQRSLICPNGKFVGTRVMTNIPFTGGQRCIPCPAGAFHMGYALDLLGEKLGMNPYQIRKKVFMTLDIPDQDNNMPYASNGLMECLDKVATAIDYTGKYHAPGAKTLSDGRLHGIGISGNIPHPSSCSGKRGAIINMHNDGTVYLNAGASRCQSVASGYCHIVAETLGVKYQAVNVGDWGNTTVCADAGGQGGSNNLISAGTAFRRAAEDARAQLFAIAADLLKVTAAELDAKDGQIFVIADPTKFKTHAEVSAASPENIIGKGTLPKTNKLRKAVLNWPVGTPCNVACGCAAAAEIAVDPETGAVEILKLCDASDVGRVIWRSGCMGQIEGGLDFTIGQALFYEQVFDPATGATLNASLLHHLTPTTLDIQQDRNEAYAVETLDALGSFGMKGVGEPPVANFYAIAQAIYNATGKWIVESPIYPWKILKALGKA